MLSISRFSYVEKKFLGCGREGGPSVIFFFGKERPN
jgi:hypothetical protein